MNKKGYIILCILVVLFILAIIVLFEKYVISANLQEGATNNFSSYFAPIEEVRKEIESAPDQNVLASTVFITKKPSWTPNVNVLADYTYYLVINPVDVPGMESNASNYLNVTALPVANDIYDGDYYYQPGGFGYPDPGLWETTTQEFALPLIPIKTKPSGLQAKIGFLTVNSNGAYFGGSEGGVKAPLLRLNNGKIIQNPFKPPVYVDETYIPGDETLIPDMNEYVARDDIEYKNLSSTDSGSTGLFVGYIDKLSYISKTDIQNADVSNDVKPTILNKKIPVYLVKGDFNPYKSKPKPVSYFDTSSYCDNKKIYIGAKEYTKISTTPGEDEESCKQTCEDDENCDMYLMSDPTTCWTYKDVSDISMFCKQGHKPEPRHMFWGKVKSNVKDNIVRYPESTAELEALAKEESEEALAQQEAQKAQQEQALAKEESEEEAKLTSEEAKLTSEEAKLTSEEAKFTSEEAKLTSEEAKFTSEEAKYTSEKAKFTSEEAKADSLQEKLALYSKTISNLRGKLATCKKPMLLGEIDDKHNVIPCKLTTKTHIIPQADDLINIHYSNTNTKI